MILWEKRSSHSWFTKLIEFIINISDNQTAFADTWSPQYDKLDWQSLLHWKYLLLIDNYKTYYVSVFYNIWHLIISNEHKY